MSQARLYLDADVVQLGLVVALMARRVDVVTAVEAGLVSRSDEEHLRWPLMPAGSLQL